MDVDFPTGRRWALCPAAFRCPSPYLRRPMGSPCALYAGTAHRPTGVPARAGHILTDAAGSSRAVSVCAGCRSLSFGVGDIGWRVRGNPVGIRDCPAAVSGSDRRQTHWAGGSGSDGVVVAARVRTRVDRVRVGARESEDLPVVPGTPCPVGCRLADRAFRRRSTPRTVPGGVGSRVRGWWSLVLPMERALCRPLRSCSAGT